MGVYMVGKKLNEARRLAKLYNQTFKGSFASVTKLSNEYLVTITINRKKFSYSVNLNSLENDEDKRNKEFAKFIVDSVMNYNRR